MKAIEVKELEFSYGGQQIINGLDLVVEKGEIVAVTGENGSGKSTLMKLLLGELKAQAGEIRLLEEKASDAYLKIGYVPQLQTANQISFPITVLEMVCLNLYPEYRGFRFPRSRHKERALDLLESLDLKAYAKRPFNELSGGLRQRVMIARAMMRTPEMLFLDEPTVGIDNENKFKFFQLLSHLKNHHQMTVLMVTHEMELARTYLEFDHCYCMKEGRLVHVEL